MRTRKVVVLPYDAHGKQILEKLRVRVKKQLAI
jgi:hypothetical protein